MLNLYLDDIRTPIDSNITEWVIVRTYEEFISEILQFGIESFGLISLDHDLGDTQEPELTGHDCLKFLIYRCLMSENKLPQINVHSENIVGVENMVSLANNFYKFTNDIKKCTSNKYITL